MADYNKFTWVDDVPGGAAGTAFTAARMQALEDGLDDASKHNKTGTLAARPAAAAANKNWLYYVTDDGGYLTYSDGSAWSRVGSGVRQGTIPCRLATTAALAAYTRTGNTIQANANGAMANIDGVGPAVGDYILFSTGVAAGADAGPYKITSLGGAGSKWSMDRVAEFSASSDATRGLLIPVSEGNFYGGSVWMHNTSAAVTLNTTTLSFIVVTKSLPISSTIADSKVIYGAYTTAGATYATTLGAGFTGVRNGAGDVTLTFTAGFSAVPTVIPVAGNTAGVLIAKLGGAAGTVAPTSTTARILLVTAGGVATDGIVHFLAIGQR